MPIAKRSHRVSARKGDFGVMSKAHDWKDATFSWVRKLDRDKVRPKIVVSVWPANDKPRDRALTQEFSADDLAGARAYAKRMLAEGAVMADVDMKAWGYSRWAGGMEFITVETESWERT